MTGVQTCALPISSGITLTLAIFALSQVGIAIVGMLPPGMWRSPLAVKGARVSSDGGKEEHA